MQFAAGIVTALVAVTLMPPAMRNGPYVLTVLAFFAGGVLYVLLEYYTKRAQAERVTGAAAAGATGSTGISLGLFAGILVDLFVDGVVIGIGSTLDLLTGLVMALGLALSTAPLAFVTIATAKRQGMLAEHRRLLGWMFVASLMAGALLGYLVLQNQPLGTADGAGGPGVGLPHHDRGAGDHSGGQPGGRAGVRRRAVHRRAVAVCV